MIQKTFRPFPWENPPKKYIDPNSIFFIRAPKSIVQEIQMESSRINEQKFTDVSDSVIFYSLKIADRIKNILVSESILAGDDKKYNWRINILDEEKPYFINNLVINVDCYDGLGAISKTYCTNIDNVTIDEKISAVATIVCTRTNRVNDIPLCNLTSAVYNLLIKLLLIWKIQIRNDFPQIKIPQDLEYRITKPSKDINPLCKNLLIDVFSFTKKNLEELLIAYLCGEQDLRSQIRYFFGDVISEDIKSSKELTKSPKKTLAIALLKKMDIETETELVALRDFLYKLKQMQIIAETLLDEIDSARYYIDCGLIDIASRLYIKIKQDC